MTDEEIKAIAGQLRQPEGELGLQVADVMLESNISMIRTAMDCLELQAGQHVMEIGHGNGGHLSELFSKADALKYRGLERSELMHRKAAEYATAKGLNQNCRFTLYNGGSFPFEDRSFDAVFTVNTLYFWEDPHSMYREIARVLKPGGRLALCFGLKKYMKDLPFANYGFTLYDAEEAAIPALKSGLLLTDTAEKSESVRGKTGETVQRDYVCLTFRTES